MNSHKPYSKSDLRFIRRSFNTKSNLEIGSAIGRTAASVTYQMVKMGLRRAGRKFWTTKELTWLRKHAGKYLDRDLAVRFNTTVNSVKACIMNHNIKPGRVRNFKKGHRPWNFRKKGMKLHPRAIASQFRKGHLPENTKHDGAITVRLYHPKDRKGRPYKWIRVSVGKWIHYHRYLWEKVNGPVPPKHMIVFHDGNTMNTALSNLKLMSMADNARRNYNPSKAQVASKQLTDNYIAGRLAGGDRQMRKAIIGTMPELIELKRTQLKLKRQLNHERDNAHRATAG